VFFRWSSLALAALVLACSDGDGAPPADASATTDAVPDAAPPGPDAGDAGPDAAPRSFLLASAGVQLNVTGKVGMHLLPGNLAEDVDVVSVHNDFYGLPWDAFQASEEPPALWVDEMDRIAAIATDAGKGVFLTLQLAGGPTRHHLADRAYEEGGELKVAAAWSTECYDFAAEPDGAARQSAYAAYVDWMVRRFDPIYVNVAVELNLFMSCGAAWDGMVDVERAAYAAAKAAKPDVVAFPSIQIDALQGLAAEQCAEGQTADECFEANYARLERLELRQQGPNGPDQLEGHLVGQEAPGGRGKTMHLRHGTSSFRVRRRERRGSCPHGTVTAQEA
jgi:hypothetical protein